MADVAQSVRASDCGPEGRGFNSHHSPHAKKPRFFGAFLYGVSDGLQSQAPVGSRRRSAGKKVLASFWRASHGGAFRFIEMRYSHHSPHAKKPRFFGAFLYGVSDGLQSQALVGYPHDSLHAEQKY